MKLISNYIIFFIVLITISNGCSTCNNQESEEIENKITMKKSFKSIAHDKFSSGYNIVENKSKSYVIIIENISKQSAPVTNNKRFFVYNISENNIIYENKMTQGIIFWESDFEIRVGRIPGMVKKDEESPSVVGGYTLNVISGKKVYK